MYKELFFLQLLLRLKLEQTQGPIKLKIKNKLEYYLISNLKCTIKLITYLFRGRSTTTHKHQFNVKLTYQLMYQRVVITQINLKTSQEYHLVSRKNLL